MGKKKKMTDLLIKKFVKNYQDVKNQEVRTQYGTLASLVGIVLNILLAVIKIVLGTVTFSIAVTADGFNNLSDVLGNVMALVTVRMAQRPIDRNHPFGHGRIEYIGALAVGILIVIFGIETLSSAIQSILSPATLEFSTLTIVLLVCSVLIKTWMYFFNKNIGTKTDNPALLAAGKDSLSDALATTGVVISILIALCFHINMDGYMGVIVALLVLKSGYEVLKDTVDRLLGGAPDKELGTQIIQMLLKYEGVMGIHDFVLHDYGPGRSMASVHVEVSSKADFVKSHEMVDNAEREIGEKFNIPICIHMDPVVSEDENVTSICSNLKHHLLSHTPPLKMHDFRMVPGEHRVNLVFDILLPDEIKDNEKDALTKEVDTYCKTLDTRYYCVINYDREYFSAN